VGKGWLAGDFDAPLAEDFLLTPGADEPAER
jgi:hypothetical protein